MASQAPKRLSHRLAAFAALAALLLGLLVAAWRFTDAMLERAEQGVVELGEHRAHGDALAVERVLSHVVDDALTAARMAQRWMSLGGPGGEVPRYELERELTALGAEPFVARVPLAGVAIVDAQGQGIWASNPSVPLRAFRVEDRPYFEQLRDGARGVHFSAPLTGRGTPETIVVGGVRLEDAQGGFMGAALVFLRPADVVRMLGGMSMHSRDHTMILRREGEMLFRNGTLDHIGPALRDMPVPGLGTREGEGEHTAIRFGGVSHDHVGELHSVLGTNLLAFAAVDISDELARTRSLRLAARGVAIALAVIALLVMLVGLVLAHNRDLLRRASSLREGRAQVERLHAGLPVGLFLRDATEDGQSRLIYRAGGTADPPEALLRAALRPTLASGSASFAWDVTALDGSRRHLVTSIQRLSAVSGGHAETVGYTRDVTAERQAAAQREDARRELDRTLEAAPVVVFRATARPDGGWAKTFISHGIERMTGWPYAEVDRPGGLRGILEGNERLPAAMPTVIDGAVWSGDFRLLCADGRMLPVKISMTMMQYLPDGTCDVVGYILDVQAERAAEQRAIAAARLASLGEMSAGLAHELKQPLQAIALAANNARTAMQRGNAIAAEQRLDRIAGYTQRAATLIEHLRRFARGTDENAQAVSVPLAEAVEGAMALAGAGLRDAGIVVHFALGSPPPIVKGHLVALEQVLANLMANARDAMSALAEDAPRRLRLEATTLPEGDWVRVTIADTGGGIPDKVLARLFEPFVTTKGEEKGTGLGLSICHGLVRAMGGRIEARNERDGAVFTILLRPALAEDAAEADPAILLRA